VARTTDGVRTKRGPVQADVDKADLHHDRSVDVPRPVLQADGNR
jgi:hypothetical protein